MWTQRIDKGGPRLGYQRGGHRGGHTYHVAATVGLSLGGNGATIPLHDRLGNKHAANHGQRELGASCCYVRWRKGSDGRSGGHLERVAIVIATDRRENRRQCDSQCCPGPLHENSFVVTCDREGRPRLVVPRNHHPAIPLRAAFATVLSGGDAESALRVDPPCPTPVACARPSSCFYSSAVDGPFCRVSLRKPSPEWAFSPCGSLWSSP